MRKLETFEQVDVFSGAGRYSAAAAMDDSGATSGAKNPPRHVLFIIDSFYGSLAGAEGALSRIVRNLPRERFRCSVVTFSSNEAQQEAPSVACPFHVLPIHRKRLWSVMEAALRIRKIIRDEKVEVVHTFFEISDILGGLVAWLSGVPVLVSSRRDMGIRLRPKMEIAHRIVNRLFDQVQAVSEEVRVCCIRREGISADKVVTVQNGVELDRILSAKESGPTDLPDLERASHIIVSVGNVRPLKGFDVLIRAASIVSKKFPRSVFLLIGHYREDSDYFRQLQELCHALGVTGKVFFLGQRDDVFSILRRCDLFCLLSRSEGMSNAILEAMAARLPVVATKVGGNAEVVEDGRTGFLVPNEDSAAAAGRIQELLRHPALVRQMGDAGHLKIRSRFTAEAMANRIAAFYEELLAEKMTGHRNP